MNAEEQANPARPPEAAADRPPSAGPVGREPPTEFTYNAKQKQVVSAVLAFEAKLMKRMLAKKPKVTLEHLAELVNGRTQGIELRNEIFKSTAFYYTHEIGAQYFEALGLLLLEGAGKEQEDGNRQRFILYQALDVLSLALQKSPHRLNVGVQSAIVTIYRLLGARYRENYHIERAVLKEMADVSARKDAGDLASRDRMIRYYLKGRRYYEALTQMAEYEKIMKAKSRPLYLQKAGDLAYRKGSIFQAVIDFFYGVMNDKEHAGSLLSDYAKLNSFIQRFNRDNRVTVMPMKGMDTASLRKTLVSLASIANTFYQEAVNNEHFGAKSKALFFMARNNHRLDNPNGAIAELNEAIRLVDLSRQPADRKSADKLQLLEFQHRIFLDLGKENHAEQLKQQMAGLRRQGRQQESA